MKLLNPQKLKSDFPIFKRLINGYPLVYLDNAATTQKPQIVIDAISNFYTNHNANIHRGVHTLSEEATNLYDEARQTVASFIKASFEEIIFTRNTTESLNLVAHCLSSQLKKDDEILLSVAEHHSNLVPWQIIAQKTGAKLKFIENDKYGDLNLEYGVDEPWIGPENYKVGGLKSLLTPKTKIVSLTHISNVYGNINPIKKIIKILKNHNPQIITIVDAAQSVPHIPVSVKDLNCDFLAFSGHKMCGPMGIGVLFGKKNILENLPPFLGGGDMISQVYLDHSTYNELPYKFEAGTPNVASAIGLSASIKYLETIGFDFIQKHEQELMEYLDNKLRKFPEIRILGTIDWRIRSSLISFIFEGIHAHDLAQVLDSVGVAVRSGHHCAMPLHNDYKINASTRISTYFYNTKEDIDQVILGLQKAKKIFKL